MALCHVADRGRNQSVDLFSGLRGTLSQRAHLGGYHGKTPALFASTRRFNRSIQRQDIGLEGDRLNHMRDIRNALR